MTTKEILPIGFAPGIDLLSSLSVGQSDMLSSSAARNLRLIFDSQLALREQVNKLCQFVYLETGGSVQTDRIFLSKPPNPSFPHLFSLDLKTKRFKRTLILTAPIMAILI